MDSNDITAIFKKLVRLLIGIISIVVLLVGAIVFMITNPDALKSVPEPALAETQESIQEPVTEFADGIHVRTGLIEAEGVQVVIQNCTSCHSAMMITQNRMTYDSWKTTIKWMQQTQNLWDLGVNEEKILTYLSNNYAPVKKGRRAPLTDIDWYALD